MKTIGVIGAGSYGTALAVTLADKGHMVKIWGRNKQQLDDMRAKRENAKYLKGVMLPDNLNVCDEISLVMEGADIVLFSVPAQHFRGIFEKAIPFLTDDMIVVNVAKGIELGTLMRMSEIAHILQPEAKYVALSGPSHAEEVGKKLPTTVTVASNDMEAAEVVQEAFMTENFRVYTNDDVCGVELGGALKNIIALGTGISDGIGFGDNARAALMTRGMHEITRLGLSLGADQQTFAGLAGFGDLVVTCTSVHSRNRKCGYMIGEGVSPAEAVKKVGMVVEGMYTAEAAYQLAKMKNVEMPITELIYKCIKGKVSPADAVNMLMTRDGKNEKHI